MALTNEQLLDRIREIEDAIEEMSTAMNNLALKKDLKNAVALISQTEITDQDELEDRLDALESTVNDIQTALNNVVPKRTINAALGLKQRELQDLQDRVTSLETQISVLQSE